MACLSKISRKHTNFLKNNSAAKNISRNNSNAIDLNQ